MFDLSSEFNKFYKENVVLSAEVQHDLRQKKDLNIERLKSGLDKQPPHTRDFSRELGGLS